MMRTITTEGLSLIKRFEGFSANTYICPAGYKTIGYGHVIKRGEDFSSGISFDAAMQLLKRDVMVAERAVCRLIYVPLTDNQLAALVSFTFNLGAGVLQRSTLRRKVNRQQHDAVPSELLRWVYAGGRKLSGLVKRRAAEATLYMSKCPENIIKESAKKTGCLRHVEPSSSSAVDRRIPKTPTTAHQTTSNLLEE